MKELYICRSCWLISTPRKRVSRGSDLVEILLWSLFIVPGAVYTSWRYISREKVCPNCSSLAITPIDSLTGKKLIQKIYSSRKNDV